MNRESSRTESPCFERVGDYRQAAELRSQAERILKPIARLVLVIDQFEEIFTTAGITDRERQLFIEVLDTLARSSLVWIIATLRSDFLSRLAELPLLIRLIEGGGEYHLLAPTREELGQMIRLPAFCAGLQFEERAKTHATLDELLRDEALDDLDFQGRSAEANNAYEHMLAMAEKLARLDPKWRLAKDPRCVLRGVWGFPAFSEEE
jgi:hypothetical protein